MSAGVPGPTVSTLQGPVQLSENLALRTLVSVSVFVPWRMVAAVLYTHTLPLTTNLGTARSASEGAELRHSTRETVRASCSRTISYARCWWSQ